MKGTKIIIFGIAVALCSMAASTMNFIGICGGCAGLIISVVGLLKKD